MMNSHDLHCKICDLMNTGKPKDVRPCIVTVTRADYGKPSIAVIEWQGSPPWNQIVLNMSYFDFPIMVGSKVITKTSRNSLKYWRVRRLVEEFLEDGNYLGSSPSHPIHNSDEKLLSEFERLKEKTRQLYESSVMLITGQISSDLFDGFLKSRLSFDELCQRASELDDAVEM